MHNLIRFIGILLLLGWGAASAQSRLPACPAKGYLHNCFGTFTFANGNKYVGEFKNGTQNGQGTFTFANGNKYVGEWKDGTQNGQGTFTFANGNKYVGEWKDGAFNGQGTITTAKGHKYVGEWQDGKKTGQGIEYLPDGSIHLSGIWSDDSLVVDLAKDDQSELYLFLSQKEIKQQCLEVVRVCRGRPDVSLEVLENLSRWLRVSRREIQISRTFLKEYDTSYQKNKFRCQCNAVFSTPAGDYQCSLTQNLAGVVTDAYCPRQ